MSRHGSYRVDRASAPAGDGNGRLSGDLPRGAANSLTAPPAKAAPLAALVRDFAEFAGSRAIFVGLFLVLGALLEGVGLLLLLPLLGVVLGSGAGNAWLDGVSRSIVALAPDASPMWQLGFLLALFASLIAVRAFVILTRDVAMARLQIGFVESRRLRIVGLLAHCRWEVIARLRHGRITHVLGEDVQATGIAVHLMLQSTVAAALLAGQWVLIFLLSPALAVMVMVLLGAGALALRPVLRRSSELGKKLTDTNLSLVTGTTQFLGGLKLALSQNLQRGFLDEFAASSADAASRRVAFTWQRTGTQLTLTALAALVAGLVVFIGVGLLNAAPATLIAFLFILARMNGPAALLQSSAQQIFFSLPAYGKLKALEAELGGAQQDDGARSVDTTPALRSAVAFRSVSYRHDGEAGVSDLELVIEPGAFVGVTGPSGAGKTTFCDLLIGLYPPRSGQILIDGQPLAGPLLARWRRSVGYVSQDSFLFHDSIRRNLLWARPDAGEKEIWDALALAGADELVSRIAGRLDAVVGERGTLLSGGERQRIALARALIRNPAFLLLDEATNAIDVEGEREILTRLRGLPTPPTMVMIAHRDSSLSLCDRVIALRAGRIATPDVPGAPLG